MMQYDGKLGKSEFETLRSLIGKRLTAYGTSKPGIDSGIAVEEIFVEAGELLVSLIEEFVLTNVCGEVNEYLKFAILDGYPNRAEADVVGGAYFHFRNESIRSINIYRAHLERIIDGVKAGEFDHDAAIEIVLESGSLRFIKSDLSTPLIEFHHSEFGKEPALPDPAAGWPKSLSDNWDGTWTLISLGD